MKLWITLPLTLTLSSCGMSNSKQDSTFAATQNQNYFKNCLAGSDSDVKLENINNRSTVMAKTRKGDWEKVFMGGNFGFQSSKKSVHLTSKAQSTLRYCYANWIKTDSGLTSQGIQTIKRGLSSPRAVSSTGVMFDAKSRGQGFGRGWQDPQGVIWGKAVRRNGRLQKWDYLKARKHCASVGGELPDVLDYMRLKRHFGYDNKIHTTIPFGYRPQLLEDLEKINSDGTTSSLTYWATLDYKDVHPYYSFETSEGVFQGPKHPDHEHYVRCIIRTRPMPGLHDELDGRPIYEDRPQNRINRMPWWYYDDAPFRGGRSNPGLPGPRRSPF